MTVRVRFAPSPTGFLHIGGLRTALYNYLFARQHGGSFILRIEDTDRERYVSGAVEGMIETLGRLGIVHDEGPVIEQGKIVQKGANAPYIQSERLGIYREHIERLVQQGKAYYCFCSKDRLDSLRRQQEIAKLPTKYDRACLRLSKKEVAEKLQINEPYVVRMLVPEGKTTFNDMIHGSITISNNEVDDQILLKSDGYPTYHLANVVDDHLMGVTHVIRAVEWLPSVPKHVMLYNDLGWQLPEFAHLPHVLNPDRSKLSKRQGDVAVEDYLDKGYLPEALLNFVALLGFNPKSDQEIYSIKELVELFDLGKVNKSGAVFDQEKLLWMNSEYIRTTDPEQLAEMAEPYLKSAVIHVEKAMLIRICAVEQERLKLVSEIVDKIGPYLTVPDYPASMLVWKKADASDAKTQLEGVESFIGSLNPETFNSTKLLEKAIKEYIEGKGLQNGNVLWPTRVALSGQSASPSPFELMWVFGKEESLERIRFAIKHLS